MAQEDIESGKQLGNENLHKMREELEQALRAYRTAHTKAIKRLYRHYPSNLSGEDVFKTSAKPELDSRPNEEVFLIYFFCFNLEELAREQISLIEAFHGIQMEEARLEEESQAYRERFGDWATLVQAEGVPQFPVLYQLLTHEERRRSVWPKQVLFWSSLDEVTICVLHDAIAPEG